MALLDTASLIVTPNGYKASKLYSIVPSDGTGDLAFSITGNTATRINSSGLIEGVNANIPRLDYLSSTCPKLLLEPQRTNLLTYSNTFDNAIWQKVNLTVTPNSDISPDGTNNAFLITTSANGDVLKQTVTVTPLTNYVFSFYAKRGTATNHKYSIYNNTGGSDIVASTSYYSQTNSSTYVRISVAFTTPASCVQIVLFTHRDSFSIGTTFIYGAQLETGSNATSYISTTTASVTRNADSCSKTSISGLIGQTEGTLFFNLKGFADNYVANNFITFNDGSIANQIGFNYAITTGLIRGYFRVNSTTTTITSSVLKTIDSKIILRYNSSNNYTLFINGALISSASAASGFSSPLSVLKFSQANDSDPYYGNLKSIVVWKTALSDSECITLTTL